MTIEFRATAFRTAGNGHIPINVPFVPGIDEQLIALEEQVEREEEIKRAGPVIRLLKQIRARAKASVPDVCHCHPGRQDCHLNTRSSTGQVITRGRICCTGC